MTDEERQRQMDFILNQQAQFSANMQKLEEADSRSNKRVDRLERVLGLAIRTYRRERKEAREKLEALVNAQIYTEDAVAKLGESQAKLAESLTKLTGSHERLIESLTKVADSHAKVADSHAKLTESHAKLAESHVKLAESQTHADKRLDALIDIVQGWKQ